MDRVMVMSEILELQHGLEAALHELKLDVGMIDGAVERGEHALSEQFIQGTLFRLRDRVSGLHQHVDMTLEKVPGRRGCQSCGEPHGVSVPCGYRRGGSGR